MKVGFIGLGNVGFKLANSLLESGFPLTVHDIDKEKAKELVDKGAHWATSPKELAETVIVPLHVCLRQRPFAKF